MPFYSNFPQGAIIIKTAVVFTPIRYAIVNVNILVIFESGVHCSMFSPDVGSATIITKPSKNSSDILFPIQFPVLIEARNNPSRDVAYVVYCSIKIQVLIIFTN